MFRFFLSIAKPLALLAVILLPVEQTLAASCCCRRGQRVDKQVAAGGLKSCCAQRKASCCDISHVSCCETAQTHSDSKPCQCPAGCFGKDVPKAVDPAAYKTSADAELTVAVVCTVTIDAVRDAGSPLAATTASQPSTNGLQRCVLLCRYRL